MKKDELGRPLSDDLIEDFCSACSAGDCTGLIPSGGDMDEETFRDYKKLYPFSVPEFPEE